MEQTILFVNDSIAPRSGDRHQIKPFSIGNSDTFRTLPVAVIVVTGKNREIGKSGSLLWHIPEDLKHFKEITFGGAVIMGRKTWESLPKRPLPGRLNIVVTRNSEYKAEGAQIAFSLEEALQFAKNSPAFIIGGGEIYRQGISFADRLYLTEVDETDEEADTYFPEINPEEWIVAEESEPQTTSSGLKYRFLTLTKK